MKRLALVGIIAVIISGCSTGGKVGSSAGWSTNTYHLKGLSYSFHTAKSPVVTSIKPIKNPRYRDGQSYLEVECVKGTFDVIVGFSFIPYVKDFEPIVQKYKHQYAFDISKGRFKWDDQYENIKFIHPYGSYELVMNRNSDIPIKQIISHKKGVLELNLVGEGKVEFPYTFKNSEESIKKMSKECK